MSKFRFILLVSLLVLGQVSGSTAGVTDVARSGGINIPDPMGGMIPGRDPVGEDNIFYDDGFPEFHYVFGGIFTAVRFTPNADFQLKAVSFMVNNPNNVDTPITIRVYTVVNQNVGQELYKGDHAGILNSHEWLTHEIPEDKWETVSFAAGEDFFLVVGPTPGPVAQNAQGWWLCCDAGAVGNRNWLATKDENNNPHQWQQLANDCMIRANGTFTNVFNDIAINSAWTKTGNWLVTPGSSVVFTAELANFGADVQDDEYEVNWQVKEPEGNVVFDYSMAGLRMNHNTIIEEFWCDKDWKIPLDAKEGYYVLTVSIELLDVEDADPDNDTFLLEQLVFNPPDADPQAWMEYIAPDHNFTPNIMVGDSNACWGSLFQHPGNDLPYRVTHTRMAIEVGAGTAEPGLWVGILNMEAMEYRWIQKKRFQFEFERDTSLWVELEIDPDVGVFWKGESIVVLYLHDELTNLFMDSRAPNSAINLVKMAPSTIYGPDVEQDLEFFHIGDYAVSAKFVADHSPPPGKHLRLSPPVLDLTELFGDPWHRGIPRNIEFTLDTYLHSFGDQPVTVTNIFLNAVVRPYITWDPPINANNKQIINPGDSLKLTLKLFGTDDAPDEKQAGNCIVTNDGDDNKNMPWLIKLQFVPRGTVSPDETYGLTPDITALGQNFPNPFNPTTVVPLSLAKTGNVELTLIDLSGRTVQTLFNGELSAGIHSFEVNAGSLPAGIYFYRMVAGDYKATAKMVLMK